MANETVEMVKRLADEYRMDLYLAACVESCMRNTGADIWTALMTVKDNEKKYGTHGKNLVHEYMNERMRVTLSLTEESPWYDYSGQGCIMLEDIDPSGWSKAWFFGKGEVVEIPLTLHKLEDINPTLW